MAGRASAVNNNFFYLLLSASDYGGEGFCEPISSEGIDQGAAGSGSEEL